MSVASDFVVVSNRLPVDRTDDEAEPWRRSPGGLVTALDPVMRRNDGAWVGWPGQAGVEIEPFEFDGLRLVPVALSADDIQLYYEGFSNDTIWPLYHDVIATPTYHRTWWDAYVRVNRRFAEAARREKAPRRVTATTTCFGSSRTSTPWWPRARRRARSSTRSRPSRGASARGEPRAGPSGETRRRRRW